jgi:hypothetical protein
MKRRLTLGTFLCLLLFTLVFGGHFHRLWAANEEEDSGYSQISIFAKAVQLLRQDYVDANKTSYHELITSAMKGMLSSLDPHSQYMDPNDFRDMQDDTRSRFNGLGIEVSMKNGLPTVVSPMEDTPAAKAGVQVGDRIAMLCRGPKDTVPVVVKLIRPEQKAGGEHSGDKAGLTDIAGRVTAVGEGTITIGNGDGNRSLTCSVPDSLVAAVAPLQVGDAAKMICRGNVLVAIRKGDAPSQPPTAAPQTFSFTGSVTVLSNDRVGVRVEGETRSCFVPEDLRPQLSGFALGQAAALICQGADAAHAKLTAIAHAD